MKYDNRLSRLEAKRLGTTHLNYVLAIDEYGSDRRLAALAVDGERIERRADESKKDLFVRATEGIEHVLHICLVDARDGKPYPWADD